MTTTTTYMSDLGRIRVAFTSAPVGADYAKVERSIDGITWTTVRGGDTVAVVANAGKVDDYEFVAGVSNTYRVSYVDDALIPTFVAAGTAQSGNNASLTPPHPAGLATGDFKVIKASIRNSGTGTVNGTALAALGWQPVVVAGNVGFYGKTHAPGDVAPLVTFSGGAANEDTLAQMVCFRNAKSFAAAIISSLNGSAQDVLGAANAQLGGSIMITWGWKQDDFTSSSVPLFSTKIQDWSSTAGNDAGAFWDYTLIPPSNDGLSINNFPITITGGAAAISRSGSFFIPAVDYLSQDTSVITPTLTSAWFKVPSRPSLNTPVTISWDGTISRPARTGVFEVLGRTNPIAVTDVQGSRRLTLTLIALNISDANELDQKLSTGDPVFIQAPAPNSSVPTLYAVIGDVSQIRPSNRANRRYFTVPLTEVAAPGSTVYSDTYTYADVALDFVDYSAILPVAATYSDLVDKISNNEVVVP